MREYLMPMFVVASLVLAGCNKAKSPEDVSKDVAKAEQKANNEVTKSEERAQSALDEAVAQRLWVESERLTRVSFGTLSDMSRG